MNTELQDYFNGLCCTNVVSEGLNQYSFAEGFVPTLAEMETKLGFTLLNPVLVGNTWNFDNVGYSVPDYAFLVANMTAVIFADSVASIGIQAFILNQLTSLIIPNSVTSIGDSAFSNNQLQTLTIGTGLTSIPDGCFGQNPFTSLVIPNNITSIDQSAFEGCTGIINPLTLGTGLSEIGMYAFRDCNIPTVIIPDNVVILDQCFENSNIETLTLGSGLISSSATQPFADNQLTTLNVNCTTIGNTTENDNIFLNNTGKVLTINALTVHETSNVGGLEGDLQYLVDNNTVTLNWI
jgi:hypothetical protein